MYEESITKIMNVSGETVQQVQVGVFKALALSPYLFSLVMDRARNQ